MNAAVRLRRLEEEYGDRMEIEWKSFLLRPERRVHRDRAAALEKFRAYTEGWQRIGSEPDSGDFRTWQGDEGPPSHSIPAHVVSKAAARLGRDAFERIHPRLLVAYFQQSRDVSHPDVLRELWDEVGLAPAAFPDLEDRDLVDAVLADHREALELGATGVPAVRLDDNPAVIVGAHPIALYRRWIERTLARRAEDPEPSAT